MPSIPRHLILITLIAPCSLFADEAPANSTLVVDQSFDSDDGDLTRPWHVNTGDWQIKDGALHGREVESDEHSAALRYPVETQNAVYQLRFRISDGLGAFHFGFDPKRGSLDKKGHLFSVIIRPDAWKIMKHVDKNRREEDPNEDLAQATATFEPGQWYTLRVTTWGPYVTAKIEGREPLKASHPTFGVPKPTLVFRCIGDGVEIDDIKVWTQN